MTRPISSIAQAIPCKRTRLFKSLFQIIFPKAKPRYSSFRISCDGREENLLEGIKFFFILDLKQNNEDIGFTIMYVFFFFLRGHDEHIVLINEFQPSVGYDFGSKFGFIFRFIQVLLVLVQFGVVQSDLVMFFRFLDTVAFFRFLILLR